MPIKISFLKTNCKRCDKELVTANQSLLGLDKQKNEFGVVCSSCTNQNESVALIQSMGEAVQIANFKARPYN